MQMSKLVERGLKYLLRPVTVSRALAFRKFLTILSAALLDPCTAFNCLSFLAAWETKYHRQKNSALNSGYIILERDM